MAELIYAINTSQDRYIADENGDLTFGQPSDEVHSYFNDFQRSIGTALYGRRMYETMRVWETLPLDEMPPVEKTFAEHWRATDKVVYSSTLSTVSESRTRLEPVFDPEVVRAMKAEAEQDFGIGGATLAAAAIRAGLVDRFHLMIVPVSIGGGTPALPEGVEEELVLEDEQRYEDGTVRLDYRPR